MSQTKDIIKKMKRISFKGQNSSFIAENTTQTIFDENDDFSKLKPKRMTVLKHYKQIKSFNDKFIKKLLKLVEKSLEAELQGKSLDFSLPWDLKKQHCNVNNQSNPYSLYNQIICTESAKEKNFKSNLWVTEYRILKNGGKVLPNQQPTKIVATFPATIENKTKKLYKKPKNLKSRVEFLLAEDYQPVIAYKLVEVYNIEQCTIKNKFEKKRKRIIQPLVKAEKIINNMPNKPLINYSYFRDRAYYHSIKDQIFLPAIENFKSQEVYYSVLFHELAHSTGHETRLDRFKHYDNKLNYHNYAAEEVVAEFASSFLNNLCGISTDKIKKKNADYIANWYKILLKNKENMIYYILMAQSAVNYIKGIKRKTKK